MHYTNDFHDDIFTHVCLCFDCAHSHYPLLFQPASPLPTLSPLFPSHMDPVYSHARVWECPCQRRGEASDALGAGARRWLGDPDMAAVNWI